MIYKTNSGYGVNFNQLCPNNKTTGVGYTRTSTSITITDNTITIGTGFNDYKCDIGVSTITGHKYYLRINSDLSTLRVINYYSGAIISSDTIFTEVYGWYLRLGFVQGTALGTYTLSITVFDLTQMFGAGNEPTTVSDFREMYSDDYYDYTLSQWQWARKGKVTSYPTPCFGVDFNQIFEKGNFPSATGFTAMGGTRTVSDNVLTFTATNWYGGVYIDTGINAVSGHRYLFLYELKTDATTVVHAGYGYGGTYATTGLGVVTNSWNYYGRIAAISGTGSYLYIYLMGGSNITPDGNCYARNCMVFDLTQMYGEGNEPATVEEFRSKFPDTYYPYTLSEMRYIDEKTSYTLLPIENHIVGILSSELPAGYVRLEYLESSGTQYIDTGYVPNANSKVIFDCAFMNTVSLGLRQGRYGGGQRLGIMQDTNVLEFSIGGYQQLNLDVYQQRHKFELDVPLGVGKLDGVVKATFAAITWTNQETLYLFARNVNNEAGGMGQIRNYQVQIYENDILVKNFIPCYRYSDGVEGMYDTVSKQLYTNSGTGTFTRGSVVNDTKIIYNYAKRELPAGFVRLDYIESTGTQWIDTGILSSTKVKTVIDFKFSSFNSAFNRVFGTTGVGGSQYGVRTLSAGQSQLLAERPDGDNRYTSWNAALDTRYNLILGDAFYINGTKIGNDYGTTEITGSQNIRLFGQNNNPSGSNIKVYSCSLYNDNTLVRNFIPCYRFSDGIEGLYDTVGKQFYTNKGTGRFIRGKEIDSGNLLDLSKFVQGYPSDTALANTTPRKFSLYNYVLGLSRTNYYYSDGTEISISEQTFTFTTTDGGLGVGFITDLRANTSYKIYCKSNTNDFALFAIYYGNNGTYITNDIVMSVGTQGANTINFTTLSDMTQCVLLFRSSSGNPGSMTLSEISLHEVYN